MFRGDVCGVGLCFSLYLVDLGGIAALGVFDSFLVSGARPDFVEVFNWHHRTDLFPIRSVPCSNYDGSLPHWRDPMHSKLIAPWRLSRPVRVREPD